MPVGSDRAYVPIKVGSCLPTTLNPFLTPTALTPTTLTLATLNSFLEIDGTIKIGNYFTLAIIACFHVSFKYGKKQLMHLSDPWGSGTPEEYALLDM